MLVETDFERRFLRSALTAPATQERCHRRGKTNRANEAADGSQWLRRRIMDSSLFDGSVIPNVMRFMKSLISISIFWFALLWGLFVFATPLNESLFAFYLPVQWGVFFAGCVIAACASATFSRNRRHGVVVLLICLVGFVSFFSVGFEWGRYVLFQIRKPMYVQRLAEANQLGHVPDGFGHTENGPSKLHVFYWQRGVVDNWSGVVYDPTGKIAEISRAVGWDEIRSHDLSELFGGTFYRCQNVGGGWYICWFT